MVGLSRMGSARGESLTRRPRGQRARGLASPPLSLSVYAEPCLPRAEAVGVEELSRDRKEGLGGSRGCGTGLSWAVARMARFGHGALGAHHRLGDGHVCVHTM